VAWLAHGAVTAASRLASVRVRQQLEPLVAALDVRSGSDARDLAQKARQVAAARGWFGRARSADTRCPVLGPRRAHLRALRHQVAKVIELLPAIVPVLASSV